MAQEKVAEEEELEEDFWEGRPGMDSGSDVTIDISTGMRARSEAENGDGYRDGDRYDEKGQER
jgi:hypothetical protein